MIAPLSRPTRSSSRTPAPASTTPCTAWSCSRSARHGDRAATSRDRRPTGRAREPIRAARKRRADRPRRAQGAARLRGHLSERLGVERRDVVAFGDGRTISPSPWRGRARGWPWPTLLRGRKAIADEVTASNDEEGVAGSGAPAGEGELATLVRRLEPHAVPGTPSRRRRDPQPRRGGIGHRRGGRATSPPAQTTSVRRAGAAESTVRRQVRPSRTRVRRSTRLP